MDQRPEVKVPRTWFENILDVLSVILIIVMFVHVFYVWGDLPDTIPTHFNAMGEPDGWGGKGSILIFPILGLLLFKTMFILSKFPHAFNYPVKITEENAPRLYLEARRMMVMINFEIVLFFTIFHWESVRVSFGKEGLGIWSMPMFLIVLFGTMGISLYRVFHMSK